MAIYRSDQAQFTFASSNGGPPEAATQASPISTPDDIAINMSSGVLAGATSIIVDGTTPQTNLVPSHASGSSVDKRYIIIDHGATTSSNTVLFPSVPEVRRVTRITGTGATTKVDFEPPLAFSHGDNASVRIMDFVDASANTGGDALTTTDTLNSDKMITWFPGVYDSVDCPDPDEAFDQRYVLGQNTKRNVYQYFKGQQTYSGAVAGMVLLNGFPLRFPIGRVISVPSASASISDIDASTEGLFIKKGSVMAKVAIAGSNCTIADGQIIAIGGAVVAGNAPASTSVQEIRRVVAGGGSKANNSFLRLNYPVNFDHDPAVATTVPGGAASGGVRTVADTATYYHHIFEDVALQEVAWNVNVKDDAGQNAFQRRYYGGKVDGMTITAEAGGLVTCDWDTVNFLGMAHNVIGSSQLGVAGEHIRGYLPMLDIGSTDIGTPVTTTSGGSATVDTKALPTTEPYYFSEGEVSLFGAVIGRVQTFSMTVGNGLEPKYYIESRGGDNRGPKEIFEGQRTYSMTATIGMPDSDDFTSTSQHNLFKELLQAGDHPNAGASPANFTNLRGVAITLTFQRGGNSADQIQITMPSDGTAAEGGNEQGAMLSAAPINVDAANPMEQAANFMVRNMKIVIRDSEHFYP